MYIVHVFQSPDRAARSHLLEPQHKLTMDKQNDKAALGDQNSTFRNTIHDEPIFTDLEKVNEALAKSADEHIAAGAEATVVRKPSRLTPRDALPDPSTSVHGPPPPFFGAKSSV